MKRVAFVVGEYPAEEKVRRERVALSYATPEVQVGIVHMKASPYAFGLTPAEVSLTARVLMQAFVQAEREGYDAVVPLGFLDLGVEGGRSVVDIPVIAPMEAALHLGAMLGQRLGLIAYHEIHYPNLEVLVRRYGMEGRIAGLGHSGFDLPSIAANADAMAQNLVAAGRRLIEENRADVIIPTGITQCPVHVDPKWLSEQLGVPVVEGIGAPIRLGAMLAQLGLRHSRKRWAKSEVLAMYGWPEPHAQRSTADRPASRSRAMMIRCISCDPSVISRERASRYISSSGSSLDKPIPPWIWIARSSTRSSMSSACSLTIDASVWKGKPWSQRHAAW